MYAMVLKKIGAALVIRYNKPIKPLPIFAPDASRTLPYLYLE